jgi:hypothetical protein
VFQGELNIYKAGSAIHGLDCLNENNIDLIITEQLKTEMSKVEFLKKTHEFLPIKAICRIIYPTYSKTLDIDEAKDKYLFHSAYQNHVIQKN